jgi:hypothetical protein
MAKRIAELLKRNTGTLFIIHNRTGCDDEAIVGLLVWYLADRATFPPLPELRAWQEKNNCTRLMDEEEQRALFHLCIEELKATSNRVMDTFVKRQKRK